MFFQNKAVLALDMDDNLCDTQGDIIVRLIDILTERKMFKDLQWVMENKDTVSTMLYPEHLRDLITEDIIKPGHFMLTAKPTCLVGTNYELTSTLYRLRLKFGESFKTCICTHRGKRPGVIESTGTWLENHCLGGEIDTIHSINPREHRNKIDFLRKTYPGRQVILVDDNPFGDLSVIHPHNPSVLVYTKLNNFDAYKLQNKYQSREHLDQHITNIITGKLSEITYAAKL